MEVPRDVILDLLPLYFADEASDATKTLIEENLERDADLARLAKQWQERLPAPPPPPVDTEAQAEAYYRAQRLITIRTIAIACCITGGMLALLAFGWLVL